MLPDQRTYMESQVPPKFQGIYDRACEGSRTAAIKVKCLECQGFDDGAVRAVRECADRRCPLWSVRPYQDKDGKDEDAAEEQEHTEHIEQPQIDQSADAASNETPRSQSLANHAEKERVRQLKIKALIKARAARTARALKREEEEK